MFGFFSLLPFSTSDTVYSNGEEFVYILYVQKEPILNQIITTSIDFNLTIDRNSQIMLSS
jgi:hypothetical protein